MTYREAIVKEFSDGERVTVVKHEFLIGMATVLCCVSLELCKTDVPSIVGEDTTGKRIENPNFQDVLNVLTSADFIRSIHLSHQTMLFLDWLLDQKIEMKSYEDEEDEDEENDDIWYSSTSLGKKWNEFITMNSN